MAPVSSSTTISPGSRQPVPSTSQISSIAPQNNGTVAVADIESAGTITVSPGLTPTAPTAANSPDVAELNATACLTPYRLAQAISRAMTLGPPSGSPAMNPERTPDRRTSRTAFSSFLPMDG